ncbi:MAG: hypothetical protein M3361_12110 [Candidatus Tectomicrobia bacterium]|jgi:hypothetical protein|nr:hypothetical protein [Candidatus Tectomicrobia bacterium]
MHAQQLGHLLALMGLLTCQQVEHLQAQLLMAVLFTSETLFEASGMFSNRGNRLAHGLAPQVG